MGPLQAQMGSPFSNLCCSSSSVTSPSGPRGPRWWPTRSLFPYLCPLTLLSQKSELSARGDQLLARVHAACHRCQSLAHTSAFNPQPAKWWGRQ